MEDQFRSDAGQVVSRHELLESAGVQHGERDGVAVGGSERADEEAVLADQGVDAQGIFSGIIIGRQLGMVEESGEPFPIMALPPVVWVNYGQAESRDLS